jgi:hypothetical protein
MAIKINIDVNACKTENERTELSEKVESLWQIFQIL